MQTVFATDERSAGQPRGRPLRRQPQRHQPASEGPAPVGPRAGSSSPTEGRFFNVRRVGPVLAVLELLRQGVGQPSPCAPAPSPVPHRCFGSCRVSRPAPPRTTAQSPTATEPIEERRPGEDARSDQPRSRAALVRSRHPAALRARGAPIPIGPRQAWPPCTRRPSTGRRPVRPRRDGRPAR